MRRVNRDDQGAVTLMVVLLMPLLVMFAALVLDGGRGVLARRQTQNAADAGALAKATDCAKAISSTSFAPYELDGAVLANTPTCDSGTTTVSMQRTVTLLFAPGGGTKTVTRSATAGWGTIGGATTLPLIISNCEFSAGLLSGSTPFYLHMGGTYVQPLCPGVSGAPPGGFGWLAGGCDLTTDAGSVLAAQPGNAGTEYCVVPYLGQEVLIPIFTAYSGSGDNATYTISGYVGFVLTGYSFNGADYGGEGMARQCPLGNGATSCIRGHFVRFVTHQGEPGPGANYGAMHVSLTA